MAAPGKHHGACLPGAAGTASHSQDRRPDPPPAELAPMLAPPARASPPPPPPPPQCPARRAAPPPKPPTAAAHGTRATRGTEDAGEEEGGGAGEDVAADDGSGEVGEAEREQEARAEGDHYDQRDGSVGADAAVTHDGEPGGGGGDAAAPDGLEGGADGDADAGDAEADEREERGGAPQVVDPDVRLWDGHSGQKADGDREKAQRLQQPASAHHSRPRSLRPYGAVQLTSPRRSARRRARCSPAGHSRRRPPGRRRCRPPGSGSRQRSR